MMDSTDSILYCSNHPQTPTALRCNRCGKPVCMKCIVRTPVGYRCRECVRGQQQVFETAAWGDVVLAAVLVAPLAGVAGFLATSLQFFALFLAPVAGGLLAELVRLVVRRRRSSTLNWVAAGAFVVGCLPLLLGPVFSVALSLMGGAGGNLAQTLGATLLSAGLNLVWLVAYMVLGASALYARLRGISIS